MLLIKRDNEYIAEVNDNYIITKDINKAKSFSWIWLWISKKIVLEGINHKFGNGKYIKV